MYIQQLADLWLSIPQSENEEENERRARLTLREIYNVNVENIMFSAELVLGARKPLTVIRA